jgi:hypothetical protein
METFAPIFRRINTSGCIFRYDSCSSFLFSGGCFTCAINPIPDRFAATRWAYARITFRRIFFNMESATTESVGVQVIGMQFHATAGLHKGARNPTWRESKQSTLSSNAASTIERRFVSAILREVRVFINWRSFIGPLSQRAGRADSFAKFEVCRFGMRSRSATKMLLRRGDIA